MKPVDPAEVPKEVEIVEKVPRIALMSADLEVVFVSGAYYVKVKAAELSQFEIKC